MSIKYIETSWNFCLFFSFYNHCVLKKKHNCVTENEMCLSEQWNECLKMQSNTMFKLMFNLLDHYNLDAHWEQMKVSTAFFPVH